MAVIKVPKTPKRAFDKNRRPSALLLDQIAHLEWAALPASQRKPHQLPKRKVKTEAQAAERVGQLTALVLEAKAADAVELPVGAPLVVTPVTLPPLPRVPPATRPTKRRRKPRTKAAKRRARR